MKLYVGNLPWSVDDKALKELFAPFGDIEEAVLIKDKYSGRSKGFGFVTFTDDEAAKKAISEMHEKDVEGRPLTVSEAKPMVPRDNASRYDGHNSHESSEAPMADPSAIEQEVEDNVEEESAPEIVDDTDTDEKDIDTDEEAKEDAEADTPAVEEAVEAEESTDTGCQGC